MAAAGAPLRTMGHRDYMTTEVYADFAPDPSQGALWAERAFGPASDTSVNDESRPEAARSRVIGRRAQRL